MDARGNGQMKQLSFGNWNLAIWNMILDDKNNKESAMHESDVQHCQVQNN